MRHGVGGALVVVLLGGVFVFGLAPAFERLVGASSATARGEAAKPRSTLLYPSTESTIRVNHGHPEHRKLRCERCHQGATESTKASDVLYPREATCQPCHAAALDRSTASPATCGQCHRGFGQGAPGHVPQRPVVAARLRFSHRAHARTGVRCLECHAGVDAARDGQPAHMPTMRECFRCHGGLRPSAPTACSTCHETRADGRLRTHYDDGWMDPPSWFAGMKHDRDFLVRHRWVAADHGDLCSRCHREEDCADCHDGRTQRLQLHPNDYLSIHSADARRSGGKCVACHSTQTFCNECHTRLGLSTVSPARVRIGQRYHPPIEVWSQGPQWHGREARRSLDSCTSCHVERDCVVCHGSTGIGAGGVSPHPAGFAARCAQALAFNPRPCRTCHGDVAALRALCR